MLSEQPDNEDVVEFVSTGVVVIVECCVVGHSVVVEHSHGSHVGQFSGVVVGTRVGQAVVVSGVVGVIVVVVVDVVESESIG